MWNRASSGTSSIAGQGCVWGVSTWTSFRRVPGTGTGIAYSITGLLAGIGAAVSAGGGGKSTIEFLEVWFSEIIQAFRFRIGGIAAVDLDVDLVDHVLPGKG